MNEKTTRTVVSVHRAQPTSDGAGVRLFRALGNRSIESLDPFLMLDEFRSDQPGDYLAGFPDHPHRGFETVTYMLAGVMEHHDSVGNTGKLTAGSIQWMTAGSGIVHSEMPKQEDGLMWGFQLWVNLPANQKMIAPRYQDIAPDRVPEVKTAGVTVRVIAGTVGDTTGPVEGIAVAPAMLDVKLEKGAQFTHELPEEHTSFLYVFEGGIQVSGSSETIPRGHLVVLSKGDRVIVASTEGGRFLLLSGRPLREPVARYGPFVMNTAAEIQQAIADMRSGRFLRA